MKLLFVMLRRMPLFMKLRPNLVMKLGRRSGRCGSEIQEDDDAIARDPIYAGNYAEKRRAQGRGQPCRPLTNGPGDHDGSVRTLYYRVYTLHTIRERIIE
jgi:hypothetical protein